MAHVQSKLDQAEVADIITSQKIAGVLAHRGHLFLCQQFSVCFSCGRWCSVTGQRSCTVTWYNGGDDSTTLRLQREKREETHTRHSRGFTLSQKLTATFQKFQIIAATVWEKHTRQDDKNMSLIMRRNVHSSMGVGGVEGVSIWRASHGIITEQFFFLRREAAVFCLITKVLFTALCALPPPPPPPLNRLFWGDLNCSDNPGSR